MIDHRVLLGILAVAAALGGCGGGGDSDGLSDADADAVRAATLTIQDQCSGGSGTSADYGATQVTDAIESLVAVYRESPDATYTAPGTTSSEPLEGVLQENEDHLQMDCPLNLVDPAAVNSITDAINANATG